MALAAYAYPEEFEEVEEFDCPLSTDRHAHMSWERESVTRSDDWWAEMRTISVPLSTPVLRDYFERWSVARFSLDALLDKLRSRLEEEAEPDSRLQHGSVEGLRRLLNHWLIARPPRLASTVDGLIEAQWFNSRTSRLVLRFRADARMVDYYIAAPSRNAAGDPSDSSGTVPIRVLPGILAAFEDPTDAGVTGESR